MTLYPMCSKKVRENCSCRNIIEIAHRSLVSSNLSNFKVQWLMSMTFRDFPELIITSDPPISAKSNEDTAHVRISTELKTPRCGNYRTYSTRPTNLTNVQ